MSRTRIAFLLPHFRAGGAERVVLNLIGALDRSRYEPFLFLTKVDGAFLSALPDDVTPIPLGASRAMRLPRQIARLLAEHRIDVAYSATNAMNVALLAAPTKVRRIVSEHTPPGLYLDQAKLRWLRVAAMCCLYPRANAIAVPTKAIAAELQAIIGKPLATRVLANPVIDDVPHASPDRPRNASTKLVSAGRFVPAKGYDTLIDACALLHAAGTDFTLDIYGEGPLRQDLQRRIDVAALTDRVTIRGHSDQLDRAMAEADLFVLASRREGFGNVLIEAMAAGTPVLATRSGGPETFIESGVNGHLVEPENPLALAARLTALIASPELRDGVRMAAFETARHYTVGRAAGQFTALVDEIVG